jgi:hypothetical protein
LIAVPNLEFVSHHKRRSAIVMHAAEPPAVKKGLPQLLRPNAIMLPYLHRTAAAGAGRAFFLDDDDVSHGAGS